MRTKTLFISILLGLVVLVSACAPSAQPVPVQETPRTLSVNGSARVAAKPDIAYITIGVHSENPDAKEAVSDNNRKAEAIMAALVAQGVAEEDIQTMGFNIYPQDDYGPNGERTGTRFVVDNSVSVKARNLDSIGDLLGAAIEAGANNINGIQFDLEDNTALIAEARKQAVEDAKNQANMLAEAAGITLGPIQTINYYNTYPVPVMDNKVAYGMGGGEAGGSVPITPGQLTITVDVNISFEIR